MGLEMLILILLDRQCKHQQLWGNSLVHTTLILTWSIG